ncbi:MAG: hypothetical protein OXC81_06510, partial [Betaproteobacteria bacterium]|nr:hypothetical protein [Betaproteobacteria bacterium]
EKPRSFGKRKDVLLGFLCDLPSERPDPSEQPRQFVLRLMRCPQETESFQIDLAVQVHPERDGMCLVSVEVGATTNRRPGGNVLCMPNLIAGLLEDFCCTAGDDGLEIAAQSRPVKEEDADAIKEMIDSPKRLLPVVVADYNASVKLAGSMAGLAHYHYYEDSSAGLRIGLRPGSSHALAHVFWPGAGNDPQLVSSVQLPAQLASASLLRNCAGGVGVWETLQAGKLRRRLTKTEKQQRAADPDAEMRDELAKLSRKCREAEGSAARLEERLKDVQCDLGWLLRADSPLDAIKQMGTDDSRTIESVKDAIDAARCDYASELDFEHIDYHKEADDFAAAKQVFLALKWLARRYVVARRGGGGDDLATSCKEACGFE